MKSFNNFLSEAEDLTPERQRLNLGVSPGQQSLPGMGKKKDKPAKPVTPAKGSEYLDPKTGQASDEGVRRYMNKRNTKGYFRTEGKPSAVKPEDVKAGLEKTKVDMQNPQEVQSVKDKINQKYGRKPADDAFAKKLGLDTPEGAAAAQDAAKDMAADARSGQTSLSGKPVPKARLQVQVPSVEKSTRTGQGGRPVGSTTSRGGVPQLPNIPKGAARVTYGQGAAPTQSFAAFSQKADAMKPPASRAVQQRVAQAASQKVQAAQPPTIQQQVTSAAKDVMSDMVKQKADKLKRTVTNISKPGLPLAQLLGGINTFRYGQSQGENVPTALTRAAVNSILSGAAAKQVGKTVLKKRAPWAIPAAAATYSAVEPAVNWGWDRVKGIMGGNK